MSKMKIEHVERYIEEDLAKVQRCRPDLSQAFDSSLGKIKMISSYLRGNEQSFLAGFFTDSLCRGPGAFVREFYIDDRAWAGTSRANRWADAVTKGQAKRVLGQLMALETARATMGGGPNGLGAVIAEAASRLGAGESSSSAALFGSADALRRRVQRLGVEDMGLRAHAVDARTVDLYLREDGNRYSFDTARALLTPEGFSVGRVQTTPFGGQFVRVTL